MQNKIQIIISLDKSTQSHIESKIRNLTETMDAKWTKPENLCLQLATVGAVDDERLFEVCEALKAELEELDSFDLAFNKIAWGPSSENPKMFWLKGEQNEQLIELRNIIEQTINEDAREITKFSPHITLAKVPKKNFSKDIDLEKIRMNMVISIDCVDVVEIFQEGRSRSRRILQTIPLSL